MDISGEKVISLFLLVSGITISVLATGPVYTPPNVPHLTDRFSSLRIDQSCNVLYGHKNIEMVNNGSSISLQLTKASGSGLVSRNKYNYGFFSAAIKLPSGFTSGVVIAFYLSNSDIYPHNHDEIDIELLGHERRKDWVLQTNIYGNGSVHTGREEKLYMWFDPTQDFHQYSILWNTHHIVFLVDNVPVRELLNNVASTSFYPSKPMSVYATIWDASEWATRGGKYPVNYQYAPFVASFKEMQMESCVRVPMSSSSASCSKPISSSLDPVGGTEFAKLGPEQVKGLQWAKNKLMFYSYCSDTGRYKNLPPECTNVK